VARFSYRGRDKNGQLINGNLDATSADGVASLLLGGGITPIAIDEIKKSQPLALPEFFQQQITLDELSMFCRQMYSLSKAGVVLNRAIRGLAESARNQRLAGVLGEIEMALNSGVNLATALRRHPTIFNGMFINIVNVGENSGRLDLAFRQLSQYMETERDTRRRIGTALRYPMFVMIAICIALVVLNIFVIPVFADLFKNFGAELPLPTKILIGMSSLFINYWPLMLVVVIAATFGLRYYLKTERGEMWWDKTNLRIPYIGSILSRALLARFSRSFALMLSSGVPLIQALELSSQAVGNVYVGSNIRNMREGIQRGESLLRSAMSSEMFTPLVMQMIQVGEETGQVDEMLNEVADFYEQEVDYDLKNLSSYIEPVLIAFIAGLVMVLALGIFLPMWDMMNVMQG
jgi:MSHA biogenesis protein MshG